MMMPSIINASGETIGTGNGVIVVTAVELLLPAFGSLLADVTVAVLLLGPVGAVGAMLTTIVNVAEAPEASVAMEQVTVPVPPTDGFKQLNAGPVFCVS